MVFFPTPQLEHPAEVAPCVGLVSINGITGIDIVGYAVQFLDRDDVRYHRRNGIGQGGIDVGVLWLVSVGHQRCLVGIDQKCIQRPVGSPTVIRAGMPKTECMTCLMKVYRESITVYLASEIIEEACRNVDERRDDAAVEHFAVAVSGAGVIVIKDNLRIFVVNKLKFNTGYVGPGLERPASQLLTRFGQRGDIGG